jgi:hypothetical protein
MGDVIELQRCWGDMSVRWERVDAVLMLPLNRMWLISAPVREGY